MPLLVRSAPERNTLRHISLVFLWFTVQLASNDELDAAFATLSVCTAAAQLLMQPSRRHAAFLSRSMPAIERSPPRAPLQLAEGREPCCLLEL